MLRVVARSAARNDTTVTRQLSQLTRSICQRPSSGRSTFPLATPLSNRGVQLLPPVPSLSRQQSTELTPADKWEWPPGSRWPYADHEDAVVRLAGLALDDQPHWPDTSSSISDPSSSEYVRLAKEKAEQEQVRQLWTDWKKVTSQLDKSRQMLEQEQDEEMKALVNEEIQELAESQARLQGQLRNEMFPAEGAHLSGAILELRTSIGGAESAVFVGEVTRMYERWCSSHPGWSVQVLSATPFDTEPDILKEAIVQVVGPDVYNSLRFESGIHRVQRVPKTTNVKKMQSSTISIVVLPFDNSSSSNTGEPSADEIVDPTDVKTETMRSRGAGGQHVNKTESAIRLTHLPTGITVSMQDSRSQHQNRDKAWQILRARLADRKMKEDQEKERALRGEQIVGLTRGDRIRTYNFPQDRVTDHRLQTSVGDIEGFMEGQEGIAGLRYLVEQLQEKERDMKIKNRMMRLLSDRDFARAVEQSKDKMAEAVEHYKNKQQAKKDKEQAKNKI